jgi:hypothetical protein
MRSPGRPPSGSADGRRPIQMALLEGAGDHAGAGRPDGRWAAGDPRAADPGDAGVARAVDDRRAVPDPTDLGTAAECPAQHPAGADRLPGTVSGRADRPVGGWRPRRRDRQRRPARAGRRLAQEAPRRGRRPAHLGRHRGRRDQVRLARLGLRLEAPPGADGRGRLDPARRRVDPGHHHRQRPRHASSSGTPTTTTRPSATTARGPAASWSPPGAVATRRPTTGSRSAASSTSSACSPSRTSTASSRASSTCTARCRLVAACAPSASPSAPCSSISSPCSTASSTSSISASASKPSSKPPDREVVNCDRASD